MKPVIDTEFGAPEAPIAQTKKPGALQEGINKKLLLALAAIGFTATHIEQANGALTLVGSMSSNTLNTGSASIDHQTVSSLTTITFTFPLTGGIDGSNGGTFTVGLNSQIDCVNLGGDGTNLVDLGYMLQRNFTGLSTATLVDTNPTAAQVKNGSGVAANDYDASYVVGGTSPNGPINDSWSVGPIANGTQMTLEYKQIIDSRYANGTATLGNATAGSLVTPINVYFTPNVPEPSTGALAGIAGTLALLRRKRNNPASQDTPTE